MPAGQRSLAGQKVFPVTTPAVGPTMYTKEYISRTPGALSGVLSVPPTFVRRRGTSCMVPSPLCGQMVPFVDFVGKTRIKNNDFIKKL